MSKVTIYHNPGCSKSRETLAILENEGITPEIILYKEDTPSVAMLTQIIRQLGISPRALLRTGEQEYKEEKLDDSSISDEGIIAAMVEFPILIQRPIVVCGNKAAIGRPPASVLEIL